MTEEAPFFTLAALDAHIATLPPMMPMPDTSGLRGFIVLHPKAFAALKRWGFLGKFGPIRKASGVRGRKRALMAAFRPTPQRVTMESTR